MENFFSSNILIIVVIVINIMLFILYILNNIKLSKLRKNYSDFMTKLGKGENIEVMLKNYLAQVEDIKVENKEIEKYCATLENKENKCLQKIGLVRYNAYKDTGSDLSFAVAILDEENTGIVLNGIYARDSSNIYCKNVEKGESAYALSKEEQEAINRAVNNIKFINKNK